MKLFFTPRPRQGALRRPMGFTLTELLIVIAIIAVLASLITVAAAAALRKARQTRIEMGINELSRTLETFKSEYGSYPPNAMHDNGNLVSSDLVYNDLKRMMKKAFPRHREPDELLRLLTAYGASGPLAGTNVHGMTPPEAIYFWLGGFSKDPQYPISGPGGPSFLSGGVEALEERSGSDAIDISTLGPRNDDGSFDGRWIAYEVNVNGAVQTRQVNLWQYKPAGMEQPYVYFDTSRYAPNRYWMPAGDDAGANVYPVTRLPEGMSESSVSNYAMATIFASKGKFQLLHAGLDDDWGNMGVFNPLLGSAPVLFPDGPFLGEIADNLANFTSGTLEEASE